MVGMAVSMLILAYGFKTATDTLDSKALASLPNEVAIEKLKVIESQTFTSDLDFKSAIASAIGVTEAKQFETVLVTAVAKMNAVLIL